MGNELTQPIQPVQERGFDLVLAPLDLMITLVYENVITTQLTELFSKHKEDIVKSTSANEDIKDIINTSSKQVLSLMSKRYRSRLLQFYNVDGLSYYVYVHVNRLAVTYLEELMST